jgi:prepilin-type N-terminal cleavage/methylation domain-containing protein
MSPRDNGEAGFSLIELLVAMLVGSIVLYAAFSLFDTALRNQHESIDRIESNDHARVGMDNIRRQLTSKVCISGAQGSIVSASDNQIEFFASMSLTAESTTASQRLVLERRRLTYRPATQDVREEVWTGADPAPALPPPTTATPSRQRTVLERAVTVDATTPFFSYYELGGAVPDQTPTQLLTGNPLPTASLPKVARIDVNFAVTGTVAGVKTILKTQILDRSLGCYFG